MQCYSPGLDCSGLQIVYAYHYQQRQQKQLLLLKAFLYICDCVCACELFYQVLKCQCCHLVCFSISNADKLQLYYYIVNCRLNVLNNFNIFIHIFWSSIYVCI